MKKNILSGLFALISTISFAQTTPISGTVTDASGKPIPFVFIKDAQHNYATFSLPDGHFTLNADPASRLMASTNNYAAAVVPINNQPAVTIVLKPGGTPAKYQLAADGTFILHETFAIDPSARPLAKFGTTQEDLHGSPYFFNAWVHGYAVSPKDSIIENDGYLFNYDKIHGTILYTSDGATMNALNQATIKKFVLFDNDGQQVTFEDVPQIDPKHYSQLLASGPKYNIYKQLGTMFVKADFQTNGITSSGNNYDSYVDQSVYYVVKQPGGQPQTITFKKKSIKSAFAADAAKVDAFISAHADDEVNEDYLRKLGEYVNQ